VPDTPQNAKQATGIFFKLGTSHDSAITEYGTEIAYDMESVLAMVVSDLDLERRTG
jgi:hypothetical protein